MKRKNIIRIFIITALILLIPLIGMLVSDEMNWGPGDFLVIGALLFGTGCIYELVTSKIDTIKGRIVVGLGLLLVLLIIIADLAVGIFNIPGFSGN